MEVTTKIESSVRDKFQTTIPPETRERAKIDIGDKLLWDFDEEIGSIIVIPKPKSFTEEICSLGKDLWQNGDKFIDRERDSWS